MSTTIHGYSSKDSPTVKEFFASDAFIRGLQGPYGSGKSSACVWEIVKRGIAQNPGIDGIRRSRWAVIRNTYAQLNDTTIKTFLQWLPPNQFGVWQPSYHRYLIKNITGHADEPPAEIEVLFRALDRPDQVSNLLSLELTGAWINEAREIPWPIVEAAQGRVGRYPAMRDGGATWSGVIMDTNPPDTDSDWYRFFEETDHSEAVAVLAKVTPGITVDKYRKLFKQPSGLSAMAENKSNLKPGYYEQLAIGKSKEWVKIYIHGDYGFTADGKAIFEDDYDDTLHCTDELYAINDAPVYRGWDWGLTPACVFTQMTPSGQWIILDEMVSKSMGVDRFSDDVIEFSNKAYPQMDFIDIGDPAGSQRAQTDEKTCFQILRAKGIQIEPGLQDPTIRWESVRKPLQTLIKGKPRFLMHSRCKVLRRGFMGGYQFRRMMVSGERYADSADKNQFSHVHDALGYVATRLFGPALRTPKAKEDDYDRDYRAMANSTRSSVTGY